MIIRQLVQGETADYASSELARYVKLMCGASAEIIKENGSDGIVLACMNESELKDLQIEDAAVDDAFIIDIDGFSGYIKGSNIRSVLYGVYAYLKKTGCRFLRPGKDGEYIPEKNLSVFNVSFSQKAHSRYRCECIEGSVRYETIRDHIFWLPKVGYNGYMLQGTSPYLWYDRWYSHKENPYIKKEALTQCAADEITRKLESDIKRAGLLLHSVGHDYMAPAFGLFGEVSEDDIDKKGIREYLALVNGERKIMYNGIRNTNFCYSSPIVREKIVNYLTSYVKEKPYLDYLQIWFADNRNNFCECENCRKSTISDLYVEILNQLDDSFNLNNIDAKIVFILYNDTCWAPLKARFNNPERFVMMTAVRQNFIDGYSKYDPDIKVPVHLHNNYNVPPNHFPYTMGFLREWKKVFDGDNFFFDYHLYSDHLVDSGYMSVSKRLCDDVKALDEFSSMGLMNCATYRKQMPTSYPAYLCGETLMNTGISEEIVRKDYFKACYGEDSLKAENYLITLSKLFLPHLLRDTKLSAAEEMFDEDVVQIHLPWMYNEEAYKSFIKIEAVIKDFLPVINKNISIENPCHKESWKILLQHSKIVLLLAEGLKEGSRGNMKEAQNVCEKLIDYLAKNEEEYMPHFDYFLMVRRLRMMFGITNSIFAPTPYKGLNK